ncbi:cytoplasmic protein [Ferrimonas pelagia]|uniref:Motility protein n=1 Tax=Ferrimonas pelagia TaxID=1177826 RepID=A0ABP9EPI1_9GAMM
MALNLTTPPPADLSLGSVGVKVAQLSKQQQQVEGAIALQLIQAALPEALPVPAPTERAGQHINLRV